MKLLIEGISFNQETEAWLSQAFFVYLTKTKTYESINFILPYCV